MERKQLAVPRSGSIVACCAFFTLALGVGWARSPTTKNVSLSLNQAPIRQALTQLFQQVGLNYSLDSGLQGNVTASLRDVPFSVGLDSILRANRPQLTYQVRDGVYEIHPRPGYQSGTYRSAENGSRLVTSSRSVPSSKPMMSARIPLNYSNAALLMQYALGGGVEIPATVPGQKPAGVHGQGRVPSNNRNIGGYRGYPRTGYRQ